MMGKTYRKEKTWGKQPRTAPYGGESKRPKRTLKDYLSETGKDD